MQQLFDTLGFFWDRSVVPRQVAMQSVKDVCRRFRKNMPQFISNACALEGNPFTLSDVRTLIDGITIGGRKVVDQDQVLRLVDCAKQLLADVADGRFELSKKMFVSLNRAAAPRDALECGVFRGEGEYKNYAPEVVRIEYGRYAPPPTLPAAPELNRMFARALAELVKCHPFERAMAFFLFGALQQFFFAGNKRTSQLMMNGILLSHGMDVISVPAEGVRQFCDKIGRFYLSKDATEMMSFLGACRLREDVDSGCSVDLRI